MREAQRIATRMMTSLGRLMFAAHMRRATLIEEFLTDHRNHAGYYVTLGDPLMIEVKCACGTTLQGVVVITIHSEIVKDGMAKP